MPPDPDTDTAPPDDLEAVLAEATPADPWSDDALLRLNAGRSDDCGIRLSVPQVVVPTPVLGEVSGIDAAEAIVADIADLVLNIVSIVRSELPGPVNSLLDPLLGPQLPPPPSPWPGPLPPVWPGWPLPFPNPMRVGQIYARILFELGRVAVRIAALPPAIAATPPVAPAGPRVPAWVHVQIGVDRDLDAVLRLYSRMASTYSFGVGRGTSHGVHSPVVTPAVQIGIDRPWFGKAMLLERAVPTVTVFGVPYPMPLVRGWWIAQLGVDGAGTALHGGKAKLRSISHGLDVPIALNGNYGTLRLVVEPDPPCLAVVGDLVVQGPTEDELAAAESARYAAVQSRRDAMATTLSDLQATLGLLGSAAGAIPVVGALVDTALQALAAGIERKKQALSQAIDRANAAQQRLNLTLAETYPERGPVGGPEDDPRP